MASAASVASQLHAGLPAPGVLDIVTEPVLREIVDRLYKLDDVGNKVHAADKNAGNAPPSADECHGFVFQEGACDARQAQKAREIPLSPVHEVADVLAEPDPASTAYALAELAGADYGLVEEPALISRCWTLWRTGRRVQRGYGGRSCVRTENVVV